MSNHKRKHKQINLNSKIKPEQSKQIKWREIKTNEFLRRPEKKKKNTNIEWSSSCWGAFEEEEEPSASVNFV